MSYSGASATSFETGLLMGLVFQLGWADRPASPQGSSCSHLRTTGMTTQTKIPGIARAFWGSNANPHTFKASSLLVEPHSHPNNQHADWQILITGSGFHSDFPFIYIMYLSHIHPHYLLSPTPLLMPFLCPNTFSSTTPVCFVIYRNVGLYNGYTTIFFPY